MEHYKDIGAYADTLIECSLPGDQRLCDSVQSIMIYCENDCPLTQNAEVMELLEKYGDHFRLLKKKHPVDLKNAMIHITEALYKRYSEAMIIYQVDPSASLLRGKAIRLHGALDAIYLRYVDSMEKGKGFKMSDSMKMECLMEWRETMQGLYFGFEAEQVTENPKEALIQLTRWAGRTRKHFSQLSKKYTCSMPEAIINVTDELLSLFAQRVRRYKPSDQNSRRTIDNLGFAIISTHEIYRDELIRIAKMMKGDEARLKCIDEILEIPHSERNEVHVGLSSH